MTYIGLGEYEITLDQEIAEPATTWHAEIRQAVAPTLNVALTDATVANPGAQRRVLVATAAGTPTDPAIGNQVGVTIYMVGNEIGA